MKSSSKKARKFSIRFTVGSMFLFATVFTAIFAISLQYYFSRQMTEEHVLSKLTIASSEISDYIQQIDVNATSSAQILRTVSTAAEKQFSEKEIRDIFIQVLTDNPLFYSLYYGNDEEYFYQIINLESSPIVRERIDAIEHDRWAIIKIKGSGAERIRTTEYYSDTLKRTRIKSEQSNYFPSQRPWYGSATKDNVFKTDPYLFKHLKITGQTYSIRSKHSVIGVDIVLSSLSSKISADAKGIYGGDGIEAFLFNHNGEVIATNLEQQATASVPAGVRMALSDEQIRDVQHAAPIKVSNQNNWGPYDFAQAGEPKGYSIDQLNIVSQMTGLRFEFVNGFTTQDLVNKFNQGDLGIIHSLAAEHPLNHSGKGVKMYSAPLGVAALKGTSIPNTMIELQQGTIAVIEGRGVEQVIKNLMPTVKIQPVVRFEQAKSLLLEGKVDFVVDSYFALNEMKSAATSDAIHVGTLSELNQVPFHLYTSQDHAHLLPMIEQAINQFTPAQNNALTVKWLDESVSKAGFLPYPELYNLSLRPTQHHQMIPSESGKHFLYVTPVSNSGAQEYFAVVVPTHVITKQVVERLMTSISITICVMLLLLPIAWVFGSPIVRPISQLRRETLRIKQRKFNQVRLVDTRIKEVHELSLSMIEMASEIERHQNEREAFIDAFICLIAQAIDDKSPYTAGHCNRVPELGMMLAKIAEDTNSGQYKDFRFKNEDERREFRIAAWLHDCGKITTPEHVVDKGTKLEANYNRIHEVRTRFEVLWRDAEIEYLRSLLDGSSDKATAFERLHSRQSELKQDFEFIAKANVGGEFMSDDKIERVKLIAKQTWLRHFDNRLGLSPFEELRSSPEHNALPVQEMLLADKEEHITHRVREIEFDEKYGIQMDVPEYQYNYGEVYNLTISRGTLTAEDRFKINEHMISGIKMLEALPFPPELSNVPRFASTHHETMDGKGYPRKLSAVDLSIPERILVIADIFEALTAADRPYKKAKPLSVAIDIMHKMALDKHIDEDLFLLFLTSGGFQQYAEQYLPPKQIDHVDIAQYINRPEFA
ncbi:HD domain-containing phosphohydrolase [Vibrio renipiscarius]|uniref:Phosphohydrolase n=1 Tax=Vibrio renipiscarius TaxID=1461322 RepID=A0A0C2NHH1_9VIBR|nr:HD domain-containing phosphohydrolase [Vibrio renipiscarius]KII75805.1 phosphohydrolase [Vibrio renipiscarius]KII81745.1 phosphohydrolase [Vibrio renipiscarius]